MATNRLTRRHALTAGNLKILVETVSGKRLLIVRLNSDQFGAFTERRSVGRPFTMAVPPEIIQGVRPPTICLVVSNKAAFFDDPDDTADAHIGILVSKRQLTAIERGIKINFTRPIKPSTLRGIASLLPMKGTHHDLQARILEAAATTALPPTSSSQLIKALAQNPDNHAALTDLASQLHQPLADRPTRQLQSNAIQTAIEIFGLSKDSTPRKLEVPDADATGLSAYWLPEDSVIEHDARHVPGLALNRIHVTGRAEFRRGNERLEVITANRRPLERVFGVDLIYHNLPRKSLVMVQYKMLNPNKTKYGTEPGLSTRANVLQVSEMNLAVAPLSGLNALPRVRKIFCGNIRIAEAKITGITPA